MLPFTLRVDCVWDVDQMDYLHLFGGNNVRYYTRQMPIGADHCQWGGLTNRNICNIHGEAVTDAMTEGRKEGRKKGSTES